MDFKVKKIIVIKKSWEYFCSLSLCELRPCESQPDITQGWKRQWGRNEKFHFHENLWTEKYLNVNSSNLILNMNAKECWFYFCVTIYNYFCVFSRNVKRGRPVSEEFSQQRSVGQVKHLKQPEHLKQLEYLQTVKIICEYKILSWSLKHL